MGANELGDGWHEYGRLVLDQLERLNKGVSDLSTEVRAQATAQLLAQQAHEAFEKSVREQHEQYDKALYDEKVGVVPRVEELEERNVVKDALKTYKWWFIGGIFTILTSVVLPIIKFIVEVT